MTDVLIPISKGYVAVIDEADVALTQGRKWLANVAYRPDGTVRTVYAYRRQITNGRLRTVYLHRLIAGTPQGFLTDHIDGDGLNNRRSNLRTVSPEQNSCNQRIGIANTSGRKGVHWHKASGLWHSQIKRGGVKHSLGYFDSIDAASAAYAKASAAIHGEYGRTS
jgi:hypothetical protein